jgi:hypothetical protein
MSQINFGLLNTNAPYEIGTSFQRGMDEAMLRKRAMEKFETDKQRGEPRKCATVWRKLTILKFQCHR